MWKRPRQIWLACTIIALMVAIGFGWLTGHVLELDRQDRLSRLRVEQEERVSLALWRMESVAMPIIAAEAARPYYVYNAYQEGAPENGSLREASPLLRQQSQYVALNFQVHADGSLSSPQAPPQDDWEWAKGNGITTQELNQNTVLNSDLEGSLKFDDLLAQLPAQLALSNLVGGNTALTNSGSAVFENLPNDAETTAIATNTPRGQGGQQVDSPYGQALGNGRDSDVADESPSQTRAVYGRGSQSSNDYLNRRDRTQVFAQQAVIVQRSNNDSSLVSDVGSEGVSRPLWVGDKLLLARRVEWNGQSIIQGCWLNWHCLQEDLLKEVHDLFPDATLRPITETTTAPPARALASIPVSLQISEITAPRFAWTPTTVSVGLAWGGLVAAGLALAYLLFGVTSLSERRAAFVSAVTHELRTPLTTFQLYTEMLASGMIVDDLKRQQYLDTLYRESGRLGHLIDNVLSFARLERKPGPTARERVSTRDLLHRMAGRLSARAEQCGMSVVGLNDDQLPELDVQVEPTVIEQILLNLVDNACKYASSGASTEIAIRCQTVGTMVQIDVADQGPGIADDVRPRLFRPFSKSDQEAARTAPGVGLGLALSRGLARQQGGDLSVLTSSSAGTTFRLVLKQARG